MQGENPFGAACSGGDFYATNSTSAYLGCCESDPALTDNGMCPENDIRPMTFETSMYNQIPAQSCAAGNAMWYSCTGTSPPFMGCCTQNVCEKGHCPAGYIKGARLSSNVTDANIFLLGVAANGSLAPIIAATSAAPTATTTSSSAKTSAASSTAAPSASAPAAAGEGSSSGSGGNAGLQAGAVAGIAIGAAVGAVGVAVLLLWWLRRRRAAMQQNATVASPFSPDSQGTATPAWLSGKSPVPSAAFEYSKSPSSFGSPVPPAYHSVAATEQAVGPVELASDNVCFELPGEETPRPPRGG